jgi:hypothetical protein
MFIQVIEGRTNDPEALHRQVERWEREVKPGAIGYLGSTGGCTSSGDCILIARFTDREAAQRNSERPEQTAWWTETEKLFDGAPRFHETTDVDVMAHGQLDDAHFVQVMDGHVADRARADALERESDTALAQARPDLLGAVTAYFEGDEFLEVAYFTTEEAARAAESREMPAEMAPQFAEWQQVMKVEHYRDLDHPWLMRGAAAT